ncbi:hypothetical protein BLNAU_22456 [Blattamonas nauphoetae]|uniref:Uncharacterized protein n=1 Tax=Blattamonas nauphoetae TaxID=2049346 RepID=A0ABQ9WT03_9EUKA|nr:hypothetical protein BLNAU_22456 [Blattamonas nauphoetae]
MKSPQNTMAACPGGLRRSGCRGCRPPQTARAQSLVTPRQTVGESASPSSKLCPYTEAACAFGRRADRQVSFQAPAQMFLGG